MRNHVGLGTATAFIVTGLFVAGCAASHPSSSTSASSSAGGAPAGASAPSAAAPSAVSSASSAPRAAAAAGSPARCHTGQLAGRVHMLDAAAGNRYAAVVLTNTSSATCRTFGYVGLQLAGADGTRLPTSVIRESQPGPQGITVRPGKSAWTRIHWTVASAAGESATGQCEPQPARLLVIPPDERTQLTAKWPSGSVCDHGKFFVTALSPGTG
jgi:Domain of unknown function (DUF4232)